MKRFVSLMLALAMLISVLPPMGAAAHTEETQPTEVTQSVVETEAVEPETTGTEAAVPEDTEAAETTEATEATEIVETTEVTCEYEPVVKNTGAANTDAAKWDTDGDGVLEILAIGNSFSVDALEYFWQIADNLGIGETVIGNLYIGGCSLATHAANAKGDLGKYTYYHTDSGSWASEASTKISTALAERDWDYITLQQWSATSGIESSYNDDLTYLIGYVRERSQAKLGWHMTWAYQQNTTHKEFPRYNSDQMTMYNAIVSAAKNKILPNEDMDFVIPSGTAVQNSRTSLLGDTTTRDGYHMTKDYGRYLTGLMWFRALTGLSVDKITYAPAGVDSDEMAIAIESVNNAFEKPFEVTKSEFTNEIPEGYTLLEPKLYKGAFWHSTYAEGYNVLHYDKSNSHQYFATPRFTKNELPVGSIIVVESGWQYRPEGWVTDALQTEREDVTANAFVKVTEEWWGDYTVRAFNISKVGLPSLENTEEAEVRAVFRIYVPENRHTHTYENGICTGCGAENPNVIRLCYDDRYDISDKTVALNDGETVVAIENDALRAVGIGKTSIQVDDMLYDVVVEKAKVNIVVIMGQSNAGNHFANATSDVTCPLGTAYWWKNGATAPVDYTEPSMGFHTPLLAELYAQSAAAGDPVKNVMVWQEGVTSKNGQSIVKWAASVTNTSGTDGTATMIKNCIAYYEKNSDLYEIVNCGVYWLQGEADVSMAPAKYTGLFMAMWDKLRDAGAEYVAFFRLRRGTTGNTSEHHDLDYTGSLTAQLQMINNNADMFMASTITENWEGNETAEHSVNIRNYITLMEEYGKDGELNDSYGNAATFKDGILTTTMKTLYGSNNKCHYGKFGYGILGADAAYNMYHAHHSNEFAIVQTNTSGKAEAARISKSGEKVTLDITGLEDNLAFRASCGSTAGTLDVKVNSGNEDITSKVIATGIDTFGTIDAEILREYEDVAITVTYNPVSGTAGSVVYSVVDNSPEPPKMYFWDFENDLNARDEKGEIVNGFGEALIGSYALGDGKFKANGLHLELENSISLSEKKNWSIEWKFGEVTENSQGFLFSSRNKNEIGNKAFYHVKSGQFMISYYADNKGYRNYTLEEVTVKTGDVIKIANRVDGNTGKSMMSLWQNGTLVIEDFQLKGSMNSFTSDLDMTSYPLSGDFVLSYMGSGSFATVTNEFDYIKIITDESATTAGPVVTQQPVDGKAKMGDQVCITVGAEGEGLTYAWYSRDVGAASWVKSSITDNTYDAVMTAACADREVYCVITDANGNSVTTDTVKLVLLPACVWEQGSLGAANGLEKDYPNVIRTGDYLKLSDYVGMTLNADHYITYFVYDAQYNYLGNGKADLTANFLLSGQGISTHEMQIRYPDGEYFRIALWRGKNGEMTPDMLEGAGVTFLDSTHDPIFWEMGSIYAASGIAFVRQQVIRSVNYLPAEDYAGVTVADGYAVSFLAYDEDLNYLGNGNPEKKGYFIPARVTMQEIVDQYPATKYVRLLLAEDPIADITMEAVELSDIRIYPAGETVPEKTYPYQGLESSFNVDFAKGLLDVNNGSYHYTDSGFVTTMTIPLKHISKITWANDFALLWGAYNAQNDYLGSCAAYLDSGKVTKADILAVYGEASYIAVSVKPISKKNLELAEMVRESELTIHHDLSHTGAIAHDTVMQAQKSQDGAIYNNTLFLFDKYGQCTVYDTLSKLKQGSFTLDKIDVLNPHANSVCFSDIFYEQGDPFPLLYVNIYNNYWTTNDRKEGTCCVYRIFEENGTYSAKLVQVLKIGFTDDYALWNSAEGNGYHYYLPYGNFVVDTDEDKLWAFVLRNGEKQTRFFRFDLPDLSDGVHNEAYGCNLVTLEASDIEDMFDLEHFEILQGCTYANGKIYSANGLGTSSSYNAFAELKVVNLRSKSVTAIVDFCTLGFGLEPEMISFNVGGDGQLYYLSIDGILRRLRFADAPLNTAPVNGKNGHTYENGICTGCGTEEIHIHSYETTITAPTCTEKGYTTYTCTACGENYVDSYVTAKGHAEVIDKAVAATCNTTGLTEGKHCSTCNTVLVAQKEIAALGHSFGIWTVTTKPTCTEKGVERRACDNCDHYETRDLAANGHTEVVDKAVAATCTTTGLTEGKHCSTCNTVLVAQKEIAALGHSYGAWTVTTKPTCTEKGSEHRDCSNCDHYEIREVAAKGHTEVIDKAVAATCTTTGLTEGKHCSVCNTVLVAQKEIPAKGHSWDNGKVTKEPTEKEEGIKTFTCTTCGETKTETIPTLEHTHKYTSKVTAPTCIAQGYTTYICSCGDSYVDNYVKATGHSYGEWTVTTKPTCTEKGMERRDCNNCDHYETREVTANGHTEVIDKAVAATCIETGLTEGKHCSVCNTVLVAQKEVPVKGHTWDNGKVTKEPTEKVEGEKTYTCSACGETKKETIPTLEHTHKYTAKVTTPTCTEQGYTTYTCICGDSYVDNYVQPNGHSYGAWTVTTKPTCTEKGSEHRDCSNCDHYEIREVAANGHTEVIDKAVAATCTAAGLTEGKHCSVCNVVLIAQKEVPAKGHTWDNGKVTKEPTEKEEGIKTFTCTTCGETKTETIPTLEHTHKYTSKVTAPTCTAQGYTTYTCTCGDSYVDNYVKANGHSYGTWTVTTKPSCTEIGTERRDCNNCDHYETREVAAKGHTEVIDKAVAATCTATGLTEGKHCSVCNTVLVAQTKIAALGHSWDVGVVTKEPTEKEEGESVFTCQVCGEEKIQKLPTLSHVHKYDEVVVKPTCTEQGYTTYTCSCGDSYVDEYVEAIGHEAGQWQSNETDHWRVCAVCSGILDMGVHSGENCTICGHETPEQGHGYELGDVNHDGKINAKDATLILQKSVGVLKETAKFCEDCAEVSGDGKLNAKDSTLILQFSVGLRDSFPAQK